MNGYRKFTGGIMFSLMLRMDIHRKRLTGAPALSLVRRRGSRQTLLAHHRSVGLSLM